MPKRGLANSLPQERPCKPGDYARERSAGGQAQHSEERLAGQARVPKTCWRNTMRQKRQDQQGYFARRLLAVRLRRQDRNPPELEMCKIARPTHKEFSGSPTVCVTGAGAGVDSAWEQEKLEARKMLDAKRAAESPASSAPNKDGRPSFFPKGHDLCPKNALLARF